VKAITPTAVLVVDDDPDQLRIARLVLRAQLPGTPVLLCAGSEQALLALAEVPRGALVLMDRVLDGQESFSAVTAIRDVRPDLSIAMVSAAFSSVDRAYAIACGAIEAIEKPATLDGWRTALGQLGVVLSGPARFAPHAA